MDRDTSETCAGAWDFPKEKCIFCGLHCVMRVTECLFRPIKKYAQENHCVDAVNIVLKRYGVHYQMHPVKSTKKDTKSVYKPPKFQGDECEKVCDAIPTILRAMYGVQKNEAVPSDPTIRSMFGHQLRLWHNWSVVYKKMFDLQPSIADQAQYPKDVTAFATALMCYSGKQELSALYLHIVVAHSRTVMKEWNSIGKYMQQGCEQKHVCGKNAMRRVGSGGMWGQLKRVKKVVDLPGVEEATSNVDLPPAEDTSESDYLRVMIKPENPHRWSQRPVFTQVPKPEAQGKRELMLVGLKSPTMYLVFMQLLIVNVLNMRFFCKKCDSFEDCTHSRQQQHGLFTPNKTKLQYSSAEAQHRLNQVPTADSDGISTAGSELPITPPQSPRANPQDSHRTLPWPGQIPSPFGVALEAKGKRVQLTVKDLQAEDSDQPAEAEGSDELAEAEGSDKRTHLKETTEPYQPITIDFPVTLQDVHLGFLQGLEDEPEISQSSNTTSHPPVRRKTLKRKPTPPPKSPKKPKKPKMDSRGERASNSTDISSLPPPAHSPLAVGISGRTRQQGAVRTTRNNTQPEAPMTRQDTQGYEDSDDEEEVHVNSRGAVPRQLMM